MKNTAHNKMIVSVGVFVPKPLHDLAKDAVCNYFGIQESELFNSNKKADSVHRRALFYTLLHDASYTATQIADIYGTTRQQVTHLICKIKDAGDRYLHIICDYKNVTELFTTLQLKQKECLSQFSHIQ